MVSFAAPQRLVCAAAVSCLIVGCGSGPSSLVSQSLGPSGASQMQSVFPASGGAFSAHFSGTYTVHGKDPWTFRFSGKGKASFLGASTEAASGVVRCQFHCGGRATATFTSRRTPGDTITVSFGLACLGSPQPWSVTGEPESSRAPLAAARCSLIALMG